MRNIMSGKELYPPILIPLAIHVGQVKRERDRWCQLKSNIPASRSGIYFGDMKINCLQALAWCVTYLTLRGKNVDLHHFKSYVLFDAIEESKMYLLRYQKW